MIHEDERRTLEDLPEGKIITAKQDCVLGGHYHKIKTELFILVRGEASLMLDGDEYEMVIGDMMTILPSIRHSFILKNDSVLIGLCSHPYDPTDDYK